MTPGTILSDNNFVYADGSTGKKLLVVLNDGSIGYYIVIKTTSRGHYKGIQFGCQSKDRYPNFFITKSSSFLTQDTWILLDQFFEFGSHELLQKSFTGQIKSIGILTDNILIDLLKCAIDCDDITIEQGSVLVDILNKLQEN